MKKILHLLPSNSFSGAENVVCTIIENNKKYNMYYCCPNGPIENVLLEKKIKYIPIEKFTPSNVKKICFENNIDIIHAHDYKASFIAAISGFNGKIISHLHCNYPFAKRWNLFTFLYNKISKKFYKVAVVSKSVLEESVFKKNIENKAVVISNVVDSNMVKKQAKEKFNKKYDMAFIGRMIEQKNPFIFLDIVSELSKKIPNIKAVMIGDGEYKDILQKQINNTSLNNNIDIVGFQKNPFKIINNTKIVIMPSLYEGFGLTAIESMCLNKPVINSGVGGLGTIFKNNSEYICKNFDEYVTLCFKLLSNSNLLSKYSKECSKIIKPYIDVQKWEENIYSLYE